MNSYWTHAAMHALYIYMLVHNSQTLVMQGKVQGISYIAIYCASLTSRLRGGYNIQEYIHRACLNYTLWLRFSACILYIYNMFIANCLQVYEIANCYGR